MTELAAYNKIKKEEPTAIHHKFQRCILWAISCLDEENHESAREDWLAFGAPTTRIPDVTVLRIEDGLPRLQVMELEKENMLQPKKEAEMFWLADRLWGYGIYMSLCTYDYDGSLNRECFDSKQFCGEIVANQKFIQNTGEVSYRLPLSIKKLKRQNLTMISI